MTTKTEEISRLIEFRQGCQPRKRSPEGVIKFKKRMLQWPNPVEYVNNMYGCHPDSDDSEYFEVVFSK